MKTIILILTILNSVYIGIRLHRKWQLYKQHAKPLKKILKDIEDPIERKEFKKKVMLSFSAWLYYC